MNLPRSASHSVEPHPSAPAEIVKDFARFQEVRESGPHFDPAKLKPFSLHDEKPKASGSSGASKNAVDSLFDLPPRFWNTPAMRMSSAEMDAVQVRHYAQLTIVRWRFAV